ncbi:MAG: hypothetical protein JXA33_11865 [Anaerolineae bacterium]|nr:hypothetical protein [Anaerolineae bacterium]
MFRRTLPTAIAIGCGLVVLMGLLIPVDLLVASRQFLLQWAIVLGGFAFILAYFSLLKVHITRLVKEPKQKTTSMIVILTALAGFGVVVWQGTNGEWPKYLLKYVMIPGESTLLALTAVTLLLAGMRILQVRRSGGTIAFVLIAVLALAITVPYAGVGLEIMQLIKTWIHVPAIAGMRGLLMGVALGTTLTGLRIIFGADRPHSDG